MLVTRARDLQLFLGLFLVDCEGLYQSGPEFADAGARLTRLREMADVLHLLKEKAAFLVDEMDQVGPGVGSGPVYGGGAVVLLVGVVENERGSSQE